MNTITAQTFATKALARRAAEAAGFEPSEYRLQTGDDYSDWKVELRAAKPAATVAAGRAEPKKKDRKPAPAAGAVDRKVRKAAKAPAKGEPAGNAGAELELALSKLAKPRKRSAKLAEIAGGAASGPEALSDEAAMAIDASREPARAERREPKKAAVAGNGKAGKAAGQSAGHSDEAKKVFSLESPQARHIAAVEAAYRGEMPQAPDLAAAAYQSDKKAYYDRIAAAIAENDVSLVETIAAAIMPTRTSRKMIRAYGLLAAIAMKAQAAG
jgi:hypothetical protein